jgi:hypothetical protein
MNDQTILMMATTFALLSLAITSAASLRAWRGWLDLKRLQLGKGSSRLSGTGSGKPELAELKERVRKLEAIANGIEI